MIWKPTLFCTAAILVAGCAVENRMPEPDWIVDQADVLTAEDEGALVNMLSDYFDSTSVAIAGITVESIQGESIELYAANLFTVWELGDPVTDNGVLVVLQSDKRLVHITVGNGMVQELPIQVLDSIEVTMADQFGSGDYRGGFEVGFDQLMQAASQVPWRIAYTSISDAVSDSLRSMNQIILSEGMITGFEEDIVVVMDSDDREARLIIPAEAPILSVDDLVGFAGRIVELQSFQIRVLSLEVDFAF